MQTLPQSFDDYFSQYQDKLTAANNIKITNQLNNLTDSVCEWIKNGVLIISDIQEELRLEKKKIEADQKLKLSQIRQQKLDILRKLDKINQEETKVRESKIFNVAKQKSGITEQDKIVLKKLVRANKIFEKNLQKKDIEIRSRLISMKQKQQQMASLQKKQKNQQRTIGAKLKIQQIKARSLQRNLKKQESDRLISQLKNKKQLFMQMQQNWRYIQSNEEQKALQLKQNVKKSKFAALQNLKEHEQKYEEILSKQKDERNNKLNQIISMQKKIREWLPNQSNIYKNIKFYDQNQVKQSAFKNALPKIYTDKRKQYANMVKQNILPNMKLNPFKIQQPQYNFRSLSSNQLYQKGNKYMQQARKHLSKIKESDRQKNITSSSITPSITSIKTDYLKQQRSKNRKPINKMKQLATLIERQQLSCQKVQKTKQYIDLLQPKIQKNPKKLIQLMNLKLSMLEQMN